MPEVDEGSICDNCPHPLSIHDIEFTREGTRLICSDEECECEIKATLKMKGME